MNTKILKIAMDMEQTNFDTKLDVTFEKLTHPCEAYKR